MGKDNKVLIEDMELDSLYGSLEKLKIYFLFVLPAQEYFFVSSYLNLLTAKKEHASMCSCATFLEH
jgi:hypothetical protein